MTPSVAIISHPLFSQHQLAAGHPEHPGRIDAILKALKASDMAEKLVFVDAEAAGVDYICRLHKKEYVALLEEMAPAEGFLQIDGDTGMNPATYKAALHAAGAVRQAVEMVRAGEYERVFCAVRPPGHHARKARPSGFCFFGNVALAAHFASQFKELGKVSIVDWDVHHGDGTQELIGGQAGIEFFSTHQRDLYPANWQEQNHPPVNCHNYPLWGGSTREDYWREFEKILNELDKLKPGLLFISAGFDAHYQDPLASLPLTEEDFHNMTLELCRICPRIISVLEGGYHLDALAKSVVAHIRALLKV